MARNKKKTQREQTEINGLDLRLEMAPKHAIFIVTRDAGYAALPDLI